MGAAGRRGASPGLIYAPLGIIFSTLVGSPGARIGFSGTMALRKLDWRFKRQLGFHPVMEEGQSASPVFEARVSKSKF